LKATEPKAATASLSGFDLGANGKWMKVLQLHLPCTLLLLLFTTFCMHFSPKVLLKVFSNMLLHLHMFMHTNIFGCGE
jgi:hypothetical protein